jgi:hypothetical protein
MGGKKGRMAVHRRLCRYHFLLSGSESGPLRAAFLWGIKGAEILQSEAHLITCRKLLILLDTVFANEALHWQGLALFLQMAVSASCPETNSPGGARDPSMPFQAASFS